MARKESVYQVQDPGRDQGKRFFLTEMTAMKAERWATRMLLAFGHAGVELPDEVLGAGMAGLAQAMAGVAFQAVAKLDYHEIEPLLVEMLACAQIMPDPNNDIVRRPIREEDIEEVRTLVKLRMAIFQLHVDFSLPVGGSGSISSTAGQESAS